MRHHDVDTEELQQELREATSKEHRRRLQNRIAQRNHRRRVRQQQQQHRQEQGSLGSRLQQRTHRQQQQQQPQDQEDDRERHEQTPGEASDKQQQQPLPPDSELQHEHRGAVASQTYSHHHLDVEDEPDHNALEFDLLDTTDATHSLSSTVELPLPPPLSFSLSPAMDRLSKRDSRRMPANSSFCASCGAVDNMIDPSILLDVPMSPGRGRQSDWQVVGSPMVFDDSLVDHDLITTTTQANMDTNRSLGGVASHQGSDGEGAARNSRSRNSTLNTTCQPAESQPAESQHQHCRSHTPDCLKPVAQSRLHNPPSPSNNNITCYPHSHHPQLSSRRHAHRHRLSSPASYKPSSKSSSSSISSISSISSFNSNSPPPPSSSHPHNRPSASSSTPAATPTSRYVNLKAGTSSDWTTPLHIAVEKGHEKLVRLLLMQGGNVNEKDAKGTTVLHKAASKGCDNIVRVLLDAPGLDLDVVDAEGWTALHRAAESGNEAVMLLFLEHAAAVGPL